MTDPGSAQQRSTLQRVRDDDISSMFCESALVTGRKKAGRKARPFYKPVMVLYTE